MAKIKKINVSEIEGSNPGDGASVLPAGVITVYEDTGDYFLRIHDGETDGGVAFNGATTGDITFNALNIIGQSTQDRFGLINLVPAETATGQSGTINFLDQGQYVSIYPTNEFDSPHIHIAAGLGVEGAEGDLFLGDDDKYVQVNNSGVVSIRSNDYEGNNAYVWYFRNDGRLELPGGGEIGLYGMGWTGLTNGVQGTPVNLAFLSNDEQNLRHELSSVYVDGDSNSAEVTINAGTLDVSYQWTFAADGTTEFPNNALKSPSSLSIQTSSGGVPASLTNYSGGGGWNEAYTDLATTGGTGTGLTVDVALGDGGYIDIESITINTPGTGYTNGDVITIENQSNLTATFNVVVTANTWAFGADGDLTVPGAVEFSSGVSFNGVGLTTSLLEINVDDGEDTSVFTFSANGSLTFPDATVQTTAWTGAAIPADISDLTDTENLLTNTSADTGAITFNNNAVQANPVDTVGTKITVNTNYTGQTSQNSNVFALSKTTETNQVQIGWIIRGSGQTITNKVDNGSYWSFFVGGGIQTSYPITIESADYQAGAAPQLTLSVVPDDADATSWVFDPAGSIIFPDDTTQTTAWTGVASAGTTSTTSANVGYIGMPQNAKSSSYTLVAADQGKHIYVTAASQTITVPANATTAFPIGTTIAIIAGPTANPVSIAITSDTMYLGGVGSTGTRTLAAYGMATLVKVAETVWFINGSGLS